MHYSRFGRRLNRNLIPGVPAAHCGGQATMQPDRLVDQRMDRLAVHNVLKSSLEIQAVGGEGKGKDLNEAKFQIQPPSM